MPANLHERIYRAFNDDIAAFDGGRLRALAARYGALSPLSDAERDGLKSYDEAFLVRFTYESNAIEGSALTLAETDLVLEGEFACPTDKRLSEVFAARGCADGAAFIASALEAGRKLDQNLIKDDHERTALDCQPRTRGVYRISPVYIKGSLTSPPPAEGVRELMDTLLFAWERSDAHPVAKAAAFHAMFENIHPFQDGNGRTGRLLLNLMLMQDGFAPIAIKHDDPLGYKTSLEDWQVRGEAGRLLSLVGECAERELSERIGIVTQTRAMQGRDDRFSGLAACVCAASARENARDAAEPGKPSA